MYYTRVLISVLLFLYIHCLQAQTKDSTYWHFSLYGHRTLSHKEKPIKIGTWKALLVWEGTNGFVIKEVVPLETEGNKYIYTLYIKTISTPVYINGYFNIEIAFAFTDTKNGLLLKVFMGKEIQAADFENANQIYKPDTSKMNADIAAKTGGTFKKSLHFVAYSLQGDEKSLPQHIKYAFSFSSIYNGAF